MFQIPVCHKRQQVLEAAERENGRSHSNWSAAVGRRLDGRTACWSHGWLVIVGWTWSVSLPESMLLCVVGMSTWHIPIDNIQRCLIYLSVVTMKLASYMGDDTTSWPDTVHWSTSAPFDLILNARCNCHVKCDNMHRTIVTIEKQRENIHLLYKTFYQHSLFICWSRFGELWMQ